MSDILDRPFKPIGWKNDNGLAAAFLGSLEFPCLEKGWTSIAKRKKPTLLSRLKAARAWVKGLVYVVTKYCTGELDYE
jgi:hypothetical protein